MTRPLPQLTKHNRPFWTSAATGGLRIQQCTSCRRHVHPPALKCPHDHGRLETVVVSGRGRLESWTENTHPWISGFPERYIVAFVTLAEDPRVRLLTNLVNVDAAEVTAGMPVRVTFESSAVDGDVIDVPLFEPDR